MERRDTIITWVMAILCLLCLVAVGITAYMILTDRGDFFFSIEVDGQEDMLEFESVGLIPGGEASYTVELEGKLDFASTLNLRFVADEDQPLADFVYAKVYIDGNLQCDELLSALLQRSKTVIYCPLSRGETREVKITYYMPIDVGDDAKRTEASFLLYISMSEDWEEE